MTLLVRDEEDILDAHLEFHQAQGVDLFVAMDDRSRDRTPEILRTHAERGVLDLVPCDSHGEFRQQEWVTSMARRAAVEHEADWVINSDADEFWFPSFGNLRDVLSSVPEAYGAVDVPRNDFLPPQDGPGEPLERLWLRETASISPTGYRLLPKLAHRGHPEVEVGRGGHTAHAPGLRTAPPIGLLELLHVPMRGYAQFERKVRNKGEAYERSPEVLSDASLDQRHLYDLLLAGRLKAWYAAERVLSEDAIEAGLDQGVLVRDERLARWRRGDLQPGPPDPAAAVAARDATDLGQLWLDRETEDLRRESERLRNQRAHLEAQLADARREAADSANLARMLEEERDATDLKLVQAKEELIRYATELTQIRSRRAIRYADRANRVLRRSA